MKDKEYLKVSTYKKEAPHVTYDIIASKEAEEHINRAFDVLFRSLEKPW